MRNWNWMQKSWRLEYAALWLTALSLALPGDATALRVDFVGVVETVALGNAPILPGNSILDGSITRGVLVEGFYTYDPETFSFGSADGGFQATIGDVLFTSLPGSSLLFTDILDSSYVVSSDLVQFSNDLFFQSLQAIDGPSDRIVLSGCLDGTEDCEVGTDARFSVSASASFHPVPEASAALLVVTGFVVARAAKRRRPKPQ